MKKNKIPSLPFSNAHAVLIGASEYPRDPDNLVALPSVKNNLNKLKSVLEDPSILGISEENITLMLDDGDPVTICENIVLAGKKSKDALIVYYAGHGLIHKRKNSELLLATVNSTSSLAEQNALFYSQLKDAISEGKSKIKLVILDCCYSGIAAEEFMAPVIRDEDLKIEGAIVLTASSNNQRAYAPKSSQYTAFSGALIEIIDNGIQNEQEIVTFQEIYSELIGYSKSVKFMPEPKMKTTVDITKIPFVYNHSFKRKSAFVSKDLNRMESPRLLLVKSLNKFPIKDHDFGVPLGLWVLKSYLRRFGIEADIYDERLEMKKNGKLPDFHKVIENYDIVGVSACTSEVEEAIKKIRIAKSKGKWTIIGGVFTHTNESYLLSYEELDYVIPGVATRPLMNLLRKMSKADDKVNKVSGIYGVHCKSNGTNWGAGQPIWLPDTIPYFDRNIADQILSTYGPYLNKKIDLVSARGCSYRCDFCSIQKETSRTPRTRNETNVIQDIYYFSKHGMNFISIKDENFPAGFHRSIGILEKAKSLMQKDELNVQYKIKSRIDLMMNHKNELKNLLALGVKEIQFGIETFDPTMLGIIHKGISKTKDELLEMLEYTASLGITANVSLMLGIEGETPKYYDELINFVESISHIESYKIYVNFFTPHPFKGKWSLLGTGRLINSDLSCFTHKIPVVSPNSLTSRSERRKMLETYEEIVTLTKSRAFNPKVSEELSQLFIDAENNYHGRPLPKY